MANGHLLILHNSLILIVQSASYTLWWSTYNLCWLYRLVGVLGHQKLSKDKFLVQVNVKILIVLMVLTQILMECLHLKFCIKTIFFATIIASLLWLHSLSLVLILKVLFKEVPFLQSCSSKLNLRELSSKKLLWQICWFKLNQNLFIAGPWGLQWDSWLGVKKS